MAKKKTVSSLPDDLQVTILIYSKSADQNISLSSIDEAKKSKDALVKAVVSELTA